MPSMAAPLPRQKKNGRHATALLGCGGASVIQTVVGALALSMCVRQGAAFPSLRGRAAPVPTAPKKGVGNNQVLSRGTPSPSFKANSTQAFSDLVALNAQSKGRQEMTTILDEPNNIFASGNNIYETIVGLWEKLLSRRQKRGPRGLEKQLRNFLFTRARLFTSAGDLTTFYGFIPVLAQLLVLAEEFNCLELTDPTSAVPAGLAFVSRTVELQFFSVVLLLISLSQVVVGTRESLLTQNLLFGRDPFCLDLWFPVGINARPDGARITFRRKGETQAKPMRVKNFSELLGLATRSEEQRRQLQFFFNFRDETVEMSGETADILVFGTASSLIAIIGALAPYFAYVEVGLRDAELGGTDLSDLAALNLRLAASQFAIAFAGVTLFVAALSQASPEVRSEFNDEKKAGVLVAKTVKLVDSVKMPDFMAKAVLPNILASALLLAFSIDGFGQPPTLAVTRTACSELKEVGRQAAGISIAKRGSIDAAKAQSTVDFDAEATAGNIQLDPA